MYLFVSLFIYLFIYWLWAIGPHGHPPCSWCLNAAPSELPLWQYSPHKEMWQRGLWLFFLLILIETALSHCWLIWLSKHRYKWCSLTLVSIYWEVLSITAPPLPLGYFHYCLYTQCPRGNVPDFMRMFLKLKYTDLTKSTYIRSLTVTKTMAREKCGLIVVPFTVPGSRDVLPVHCACPSFNLQPARTHSRHAVAAHIKCLEP